MSIFQLALLRIKEEANSIRYAKRILRAKQAYGTHKKES